LVDDVKLNQFFTEYSYILVELTDNRAKISTTEQLLLFQLLHEKALTITSLREETTYQVAPKILFYPIQITGLISSQERWS